MTEKLNQTWIVKSLKRIYTSKSVTVPVPVTISRSQEEGMPFYLLLVVQRLRMEPTVTWHLQTLFSLFVRLSFKLQLSPYKYIHILRRQKKKFPRRAQSSFGPVTAVSCPQHHVILCHKHHYHPHQSYHHNKFDQNNLYYYSKICTSWDNCLIFCH